MRVRWVVWSVALVVGIGAGVGIAAATQAPREASATIPKVPQIPNPRLDTGTPLSAVAPVFTLTDQFGKTQSLRSFRGKVVVLSFNDPECTTICPLTTTALSEAKKLLGPAAANVQLLGVGANPEATEVKWVRSYSKAHQMMRKWLFLTGSLPRLKNVWKSYGIEAAVVQGAIDHTPATYVVDPNGRMTRLFLTNMSYSSVPQLAQVLAHAIAADLPGRPKVRDTTSLARVKLIGPRQRVEVRLAKGTGSFPFGPGNGMHLILFFNTWDPDIAANLRRFAGFDDVKGLPGTNAIDELNVEPSAETLQAFLDRLDLRLFIGVDPDGRIADGYGVQDSPWLTLVSNSGKILWSYDVAVKGWPSTASLVKSVHAALAHARG
ncbi:MAG TPA: SCO family protein [Gaiellaceae bacterium]|jgi:cytochrome oxidase Cu insertion factor (SCO1/SenC/PrrC family)